MGILFKGGTIVTAADTFRADVLVEGEQIAHIGVDLSVADHRLIDAQGKYLLHGGIDVHTHLALPVSGTQSSDDFFTGHRAAAFGGTTCHIDFAIQQKGESLAHAFQLWQQKAAGKACIDYGFHMTITDLTDSVAAEIPSMVAAGLPSLKLLMAYKGAVMVDDLTMFRVMQIAAAHGMLVMVHAENGDALYQMANDFAAAGHTAPIYHALSRPPALEGEATHRAIRLAEVAGCNLYIVHMTCREAVSELRRARAHGLPVMGETCIQYLFRTIDDLRREDGAKFVCSPPLRTAEDHQALWQALRDDTLQIVSTDHCPFWYEGGIDKRSPGKELGTYDFRKIPNGVPALEDRLMMLWAYGVDKGRFDLNRFVALNSTNPAKIFGLYPRKGAVIVGADADLVLWDSHQSGVIRAATHHMQVDYNLFEGMPTTAKPSLVMARGKLLVEGNQWLGEAGYGRFVPRHNNAPVL
jgi:dihydropyrimidinase